MLGTGRAGRGGRGEVADGLVAGLLERGLGHHLRRGTGLVVVGLGLACGHDRLDHRGLERGHGPGGVEQPLQGVDRGLEPRPLVVDVALEHLDVGHELVADRLELVDLGQDPVAGLVAGAADLLLRLLELALVALGVVGPVALGLVAGGADDALGLLLRLGDGGVGGALREQEGSAQGVVDLPGRRRGHGRGLLGEAGLGGLGPLGHLPEAHLELADGHADPLEEVVHLVGVVAAELLLAEVDVFQELRRDVHPPSVPNASRAHGDARPGAGRVASSPGRRSG